jgi:predicted ribosome quality control (RQC) complex YloA/Tae2 family protein
MRVEHNNTWYVIGKSAQDNWRIINNADKNYYWVHANNVPSSHIIIEIDIPIDSEIEYACNLCKNQTKIVKDSKIEYIVTQIKNIKLGSKPGEVYFKDKSLIKIVKY